MLGHSSGIIGLPLRLLAREVYNKIADRAGSDAVALVTGEEKIKPSNPRYWVSTVEAMPRDIDVAFLAVDEIQLGADFERGHVFTDRMLNRRGREETLVLGAATARPLIEKLLPGAHIVSRPRLSQLTFAGDRKITRLPRRSAIVAFSADEVYAIAELIRRQRGGAAVVLGALSPRTRNAQVALYQNGDVDYLIATDAIGMGLNLDVDHVAFASDRKFDGYQFRQLNPAELAQIAGRAGRASRDGTFGTTGRCTPFEPELVQQLESHSFEPLKLMQWRNSDLDFSSIGALQASLAAVPTETGLTRAPVAEDILVLEHAARDDAVRDMARNMAAVERLWDVCQVPDYRKTAPATHAELAVTLYGFLTREGKIPVDWFAGQVAQTDRTDGDIDALSARIAHVRTWTFVANRPDWLADPDHWQGVTRAVEDKLSDALHERLTERFVDRRTSVLMRRLRENTMLDTEISKTGEVVVEGHVIGRLDGFVFAADNSAGGSDAKALQGAAQKALAGEIDARATRLSQAPDDQFVLASDDTIRWLGQPVGRLIASDASDALLRPRVRIVADEQLTGASREAVQTRLDLWIKAHIDKVLGPLALLSAAEDLTGIARGIAFQLVEALGVLERQKVAEEVKGLDQTARASLRKYGVRFGAYHIYIPPLLKPAPRLLATQLYALKHEGDDTSGVAAIQQLASSGRTSIPVDPAVAKPLYRIAGFRVCGERAVRVDILERLADLIRPALAWRDNAPGVKPPGALDGSGFTVTGAMLSLTGCSGEDFASILRSLGYRMEKRPKPPEPPPAPAVAEGAEPATGEAAEAATTEAATSEDNATATTLAATDADDAAITASDSVETAAPAAEPETVEDTVAPGSADAATEPSGAPDDETTPVVAGAALVPDEAVPTLDAAATDGHGDGTMAAADAPPAEPATPSAAEPGAAGSDDQSNLAPEDSSGAAASEESAAAESTTPEVAADQENSAALATEEPELIEVWRPGRQGHRSGGRPERRPREDRPHRHGGRRHDRPHADQQPTAAAATAPSPDGAVAAQATDTAIESGAEARQDRPARDDRRPRHHRGPRGERPDGPERQDRPARHGRPDRGPRESRPDRGDDRGRKNFSSGNNDFRSRREKQPDPDSPFAKLAALKAQLEANAKEGR